ncbi:unnamed protein product [Sphagnum troendelagicum]
MADAAAAAAAASSSSPSLDFLSPEFDALEALRCEGLQPPNPRVRPLDNLNKCLSILPQELSESFVSVPVREPRSQESIAAQQRAKARTSLQMEKAAERARQTKVLDAMAEKLKDGPLGLLVECYEKRGRVLVWTRHAHGIRGTLVGFLLAVDKHFNMVLQDVDEQYTVRRQVPRLVRKRGGHIRSSQQEDKEIQCPPEANCIDEYLGNQTVQEECGESVECLIRDMMELKLFPKLERRRRHLNQVFVRGDSVVMVQKLI